MPEIKRIDHIAILTDDLDASLVFWRDTLGLKLTHVTYVPDEGSMVAFLPTGGSEIELVKPTTTDSGLARYLEKRGPGMHHVCLEVDDLAEIITRLKEKGLQLINEEPRTSSDGRKYAFIHPKSTHGVLVELYQITGDKGKRNKG
jgi:methylmalonyl-CoA/ethylmalonyl-CoA epimerase